MACGGAEKIGEKLKKGQVLTSLNPGGRKNHRGPIAIEQKATKPEEVNLSLREMLRIHIEFKGRIKREKSRISPPIKGRRGKGQRGK